MLRRVAAGKRTSGRCSAQIAPDREAERGGHPGSLILDLGCGTGEMTERLAAEGYDMIGVDGSPDMLEEAEEKKLETGHEILYLLQICGSLSCTERFGRW